MPASPRRLTIDASGFLLDGSRHQIIAGSFPYFRTMPTQWADRFRKLAAFGANTVETYVPWNLHEPHKGEYDFEGRCDLEQWLELAATNGLDVMLRPGPYICAEWDLGGLPWWLLNEPDIALRTSDPTFLSHVDDWWDRLVPRVLPYLASNGGPVTSVQIENEYGYFGDDTAYLEHLRDGLRGRGVDVLLFTSDGPYSPETLRNGGLDDVLRTANFGGDVPAHLATLRGEQPVGPLVCAEYWVGWFDTWGEPRAPGRSAADAAAGLRELLAADASVNLYVFAGGTNFGFMAGANHADTYAPHVTSYDYGGLLTESGDVTEKYEQCRDVIAAHTGRTDLIQHFAPSPKLELGELEFSQHVDLNDALTAFPQPIRSPAPRSFERLGIGHGYVLYRSEISATFDGFRLRLRGMHDVAHVAVDGRSLGVWYRNDPEPDWTLEVGDTTARLDILVEAMGRPNFGHRIHQHKGITEGVFLGTSRQEERAHFGWAQYPLVMEPDRLSSLPWRDAATDVPGPRFHRAEFAVEQPTDTFLALANCTKGFAVVNGVNLGRYWDVGPQRALYVPAPVLHNGTNELVVFDIFGRPSPGARLQAHPDVG